MHRRMTAQQCAVCFIERNPHINMCFSIHLLCFGNLHTSKALLRRTGVRVATSAPTRCSHRSSMPILIRSGCSIKHCNTGLLVAACQHLSKAKLHGSCKPAIWCAICNALPVLHSMTSLFGTSELCTTLLVWQHSSMFTHLYVWLAEACWRQRLWVVCM